jgi:integrase
VASGEITANSANKEITHFCGVMRRVNEMKQLGLTLPFEKLRLDVKSQRTKRNPFSRNWIETRILARGALDGLNHEARRVLLMMVNTGARPSELAGLMLKHVDLDGPIPTIEITPEGRALKNEHSERRIPLHGVSLDAATAAVEAAVKGGRDQLFPSYFGKDKVSDTVNKFMRENGLKENEGTTLYSLRHAFEDRMIEADVADRVRADLFGHAIQRERYGDGGGDEVRYRAVRSVSIHQP